MKGFVQLINRVVPSESKSIVNAIETDVGFVPNVIEGLARSPQALESYRSLSTAFGTSSLTQEEQQVVLLTASRYNECEYCTSVHSLTAESTELKWGTIEKIRNRETLPNERHEALRRFTESVLSKNGSISPDVWTEFTTAGFDERNALDVVLGITLKTLTNTTNHLFDIPLDDQFQKRAWSADRSDRVTV